MLFPYKRLNDLFQSIRQNNFLSAAKLSASLGVSERTIRSDVSLLNEILQSQGAKISLKRKAGYYLEITSAPSFSAFLELLEQEASAPQSLESQENRISRLVCLLLDASDYLDIEFLAEQIFVSRATLANYLKLLATDFEAYSLELIFKPVSKCKLIGRERDKRSYLADRMFQNFSADSMIHFTKEESRTFPALNLNLLKSLLFVPLAEAGVPISDLNLKKLVLYTAAAISRIQLGFAISIPESIVYTYPMKTILETWVTEIQRAFDIVIQEEEKKYLYLHLVSICDYDTQIINHSWLENSVSEFLDIIYQDFSIDLRVDDALFTDLTRHLYSILKAKALNIKEKNPMLNVIKSHFPLPFEITFTCIRKAFYNSGYEFTEDDIAYISLHIGAAMERFLAGRRDKRTALLLCSLGLSAARMLETMLCKYFQDSLIIRFAGSYASFAQLKEEDFKRADFIISTAPLTESPIPFVTVGFPIASPDIEAVSKMIHCITKNKSKSLLEFFHEDLWIRLDSPVSKQQILKQLSSLLEAQGFVSESFLNKVLERERLGKTNMNEIFALPHPVTPCSKQTKVAAALLDSPIKWNGEETVQLIFLFSLRVNEEAELDKLYGLFAEIMNNPLLCKRLLKAESFLQFTQTLGEYL